MRAVRNDLKNVGMSDKSLVLFKYTNSRAQYDAVLSLSKDKIVNYFIQNA